MPVGRPTKFTPEIAERILGFVRLGHTANAACEACGIAGRTLRSWLQKAREEPGEYPEFAEFLPRYIKAEGCGIMEFEKRVIADGIQDGDLALKILERRRWRDWSQQGWRIKEQERQIKALEKELEGLRALVGGAREE